MKLPFKMAETITSTLEPLYENQFNKAQIFYSVFFIKAGKTEDGEIVEGVIAPRFIILYSDNRMNIDRANSFIKKLIGDSMDYEFSDTGALPDSYTDQTNIILHRRSRALKAESLIEVFEKGDTYACYTYLMKSTFKLKIEVHDQGGTRMYSATTHFIPSTADIIADSGKLVYHTSLMAIEKAITSKYCNYEQEIDLNFDNCYIDYNVFAGEFDPPANNEEFVKLMSKNLLASTNKNL